MEIDFKTLTNDELIQGYGEVVGLMKSRGIIRSKNVVGDLGEYLAIQYYNKTPGLPKLQPAPPGTKNIDAISINGERYSIKSTTGTITGVVYGLKSPGTTEPEEQKFEYLLVVILDNSLKLKRINELTWNKFLVYKRWHSRMAAWNLSITQELLRNTRTIYQQE